MVAAITTNLTSTTQVSILGFPSRGVSKKGLRGERCLLSSFYPKLNIQMRVCSEALLKLQL